MGRHRFVLEDALLMLVFMPFTSFSSNTPLMLTKSKLTPPRGVSFAMSGCVMRGVESKWL